MEDQLGFNGKARNSLLSVIIRGYVTYRGIKNIVSRKRKEIIHESVIVE